MPLHGHAGRGVFDGEILAVDAVEDGEIAGIVQPDVDFDHILGAVACLTEGLHEVVQRLPGLFRDAADHKFPFGVFRDLTGDEQPAVRLHRLRSGHAALLGQTETLNASHKLLLSSLGRAVARHTHWFRRTQKAA